MTAQQINEIYAINHFTRENSKMYLERERKRVLEREANTRKCVKQTKVLFKGCKVNQILQQYGSKKA